MRETTGTKQTSPWADGTRPEPKRSATVTAALLLAVSSAAVPLSLVKPWVGIGLWAVMLIGCAVLLRAMRVGVTLTLVASVASLLFTGTYLFAGTLAAALAVGTFAGAFLMTSLKKPYLACLIPLVSVGVTAIFTRDWLFLLATLSLLPAGALTAFATRRGMGRTTVICYGAAGLLAAALLLVGLAIARTDAGLSLETVQGLLDTWKGKLLAERMEMRDELLAMLERAYENAGSGNTQSAQSVLEAYRQMMSDASLEAGLTSLFNVLPGAVVAIALIASYLGQLLLLEGYDAAGMRAVITPESEFLVMSLPAAVIWTVSTVAGLMFDTSYAVPVVTMENLSLILTPGFCAVGWHALMKFFRAVPARSRWVLVMPAAALACCALSSVFWILAAYGAYATVLSAIRRAIIRRGGTPPANGGTGDSGDTGDSDGSDDESDPFR